MAKPLIKHSPLGFEAKPRNLRSSSPYAWCRPHTVPLDPPIIRPLSTQPVLDHPWSCPPCRTCHLHTMPHLSPAHHETSKRDSPHKINNKGRTMETFRIQIQTEASQLLIPYQTKILATWFLTSVQNRIDRFAKPDTLVLTGQRMKKET
jgi:hypothetical protein